LLHTSRSKCSNKELSMSVLLFCPCNFLHCLYDGRIGFIKHVIGFQSFWYDLYLYFTYIMQFRLTPNIALVRGYKKLLTYFHSDQIICLGWVFITQYQYHFICSKERAMDWNLMIVQYLNPQAQKCTQSCWMSHTEQRKGSATI
jgi:hypothetical protein